MHEDNLPIVIIWFVVELYMNLETGLRYINFLSFFFFYFAILGISDYPFFKTKGGFISIYLILFTSGTIFYCGTCFNGTIKSGFYFAILYNKIINYIT